MNIKLSLFLTIFAFSALFSPLNSLATMELTETKEKQEETWQGKMTQIMDTCKNWYTNNQRLLKITLAVSGLATILYFTFSKKSDAIEQVEKAINNAIKAETEKVEQKLQSQIDILTQQIKKLVNN